MDEQEPIGDNTSVDMRENGAMHLVLFDIDGTLLDARGAGRRAMRRTLKDVFGTWGILDSYNMAGRTDRTTIRDVLTAVGFSAEEIEQRMPEVRRLFPQYLEEELRTRPPVPLAGAKEIVKRLQRRDDVVLGLLTGNLEEGAYLKLRYAGFDPEVFRINAFGSDALTRDELPHIALERAKRKLGLTFRRDEVVIVGDTPLDIQCSQVVGAKSVVVTTGPFSAEELRRYHPDVILPDLRDTLRVEAVILNGRTREVKKE